MKTIKKILFSGLLLFSINSFVYADSMIIDDPERGQSWDSVFEKGGVNFQNFEDKDQNAIEKIKILFLDKGFGGILKYLIVSFGILMVFYQIIMIINSSHEEKLDEEKEKIAYIVLGFFMISLSTDLAKIFDPVALKGGIISKSNLSFVTTQIINYISLLGGGILMLIIAKNAFNLIKSQGDSDEISKVKENILHSSIGVFIVVFADLFINKIIYRVFDKSPQVPGEAEMTSLIAEIVGFLQYIFEYLAVFNVILLIGAGVNYMMKTDDSDEKLEVFGVIKKLAVSFISITIAYTLVSFIVS